MTPSSPSSRRSASPPSEPVAEQRDERESDGPGNDDDQGQALEPLPGGVQYEGSSVVEENKHPDFS